MNFFYRVLYPLVRPFYLMFLILNTIAVCLTIIIISPFDKKGNTVHYIGKFWSLLNIFLSGTRLTIRGKEKINTNLTHIVMSNHQSLFDVWALIGKIPLQIRWIVKAEIRKYLFSAILLKEWGIYTLTEKNGPQHISALKQPPKRLKMVHPSSFFRKGQEVTTVTCLNFEWAESSWP